MLKKLKLNKRGQEGGSPTAAGFWTIVIWAIIIGVAITVIVWMAIYAGIGKNAFEKITNTRFV